MGMGSDIDGWSRDEWTRFIGIEDLCVKQKLMIIIMYKIHMSVIRTAGCSLKLFH